MPTRRLVLLLVALATVAPASCSTPFAVGQLGARRATAPEVAPALPSDTRAVVDAPPTRREADLVPADVEGAPLPPLPTLPPARSVADAATERTAAGVELPDPWALPVAVVQVALRVDDVALQPGEAEARAVAVAGVAHAAAITLGTVPVEGQPMVVAAVDVTTFRPFSPQITADSTSLWARLAEGDAAFSFDVLEQRAFGLGSTVSAHDGRVPLRVGAYATTALPPVADAIVTRPVGEALGVSAVSVLVALHPQEPPARAAAALREALDGATVVEVPDPRAPAERVLPTGEITPENVWDHLAVCESSGNWQINTGNGYYGGLQFLPESWWMVGGQGLPHEATREEQIHRATLLWQLQGWEAWPQCARRLGLIPPAPPPPPVPPPAPPAAPPTAPPDASAASAPWRA